jgi:AcrR family transcriptional regulator
MEVPGPLRAVRSWEETVPTPDSDVHVLEAMLLTVGERGYANTTVREVANRARITQERFHRRFGGREACFARAYEEAAARLAGELLKACEGAAGWRDGFEAALARLLRFVAEEPVTARALLLEVRAARGEAWAKHQELTERLTTALDGARQEPGARPSVTPMTTAFVAGAIEESLCIELAAGRGAAVERLLPELTRLTFLQLFGEDEAASTTSRGRRGAGPRSSG